MADEESEEEDGVAPPLTVMVDESGKEAMI